MHSYCVHVFILSSCTHINTLTHNLLSYAHTRRYVGKHQWWQFFVQDIMGVSVVILFLTELLIPNLKTITAGTCVKCVYILGVLGVFLVYYKYVISVYL